MRPRIDCENPRTPLESAMADAMREMTARGHPESTQFEYTRIWRHLLEFALQRGKDRMTPELEDEFLDSLRATEGAPGCCGKKRMVRAIRAVRTLRHFVSYGVWAPYQAGRPRREPYVPPIGPFRDSVTPLDTAVVEALRTMESLGYPISTRYTFNCVWKNLLAFADEAGEDRMSAPLGERFLEAYEARGTKNRKCPKCRMGPARRAVRSLAYFADHGNWEPFRPRKKPPALPPLLAADLEVYIDYMRNGQSLCSATQAFRRRYLQAFLVFLSEQGVHGLAKLTPSLFTAFFAGRMQMQPASLEGISGVLRAFFRFMLATGRLEQDWSPAIPRFRGFLDQKVPAVWTQEMVETVLDSIPRDTPEGKRDRAILLLACRFGMRAGDIRSLKIESLRWDDNRIEFAQTKTGRQVILPLTRELGDALIDYLLNGRPTSAHREVFLRSKPPHRPFRVLTHIVRKYCETAQLAFPNQHAGMHSLRHTVASQLLVKGVSLETISQVLGHASPNSTRIYAKVDVAQLRTAALDPEEVCHALS